MKNNFKMLFFFMMIFSTMFLLSSISWFNLWIWLEINLISFISLMINNKNKLSIESSIIYFLIQSIASIILLFSIIMMLFYNNLMILMMMSILMKIGSAPLHFWLPMMIEGLEWMNIFFLLTWQKINPLIMLYYNNFMKYLFFFIILSLIIGSIKSFNNSSLKKIISYSSINQLSWMMISLIYNNLLKLYLLFYFYLMFNIINSLKLINIKYLNEMFNLKINNKFIKLFIFSNFLSLGGLPPFLGFFPKLIIIMKMNNSMIMLIMVIFTLLMLFIYFRIIYIMFLLNSIKINKIKNTFNIKNLKIMMKISIINNFMLILMFFIY